MINYTNPRPPAQRRPLRSVNENVALLRSPGPLESMLKTTTETGDIGIFSIRPNSSAQFARPSRSRSHARDADLLLPMRTSGYDENYYCHPDDHRKLRSYRDTTSEIISLYGSDSQHTLLSSVSPASLEDDHRSYSMTTTSSKRIPSQKSTGTLQSQSSGGGFQRPRSPFPYPTRLKRPGVRPASPALRDNGDIDYSRMVELDRFSQRTVHGSYKPTYAHGSRRPPQLSLRPDGNRSTSSLSSRAMHSPYYYPPGSCHTRAPNPPSMPWAPRPPNRHQRSSADQSTRSASLTSIVEMYDRPATSSSNCAPLRSTGSFYYDYSEQFEDQPPWDMDMDIPLHPIPQRADNIRQSLLLMDDAQASFDMQGNDDSDSIKSNLQNPEKDVIDQSHLSNGGTGNSQGTEAKRPSSPDGDDIADTQSPDEPNFPTVPLIAISDEDQSQPPSLSNEASPATEAAATDTPSMMSDSVSTTPSPSSEIPSKISEARLDVADDHRSRQSSHGGISMLRYSLDPALSDLASIISSFDRLGRVPTPRDSEVQSTSGGRHDTSVYQHDEADSDTLKQPSRPSPLLPADKTGAEEGAYQKCHRRNMAAMRISTAGVVPKDFVQNSPERQGDLNILSPEPISPVRELRVKESIPQLMKALPPLPREAEKLSGYGTAGIPPLSAYLGHDPLVSGKNELLAMKPAPSSAAVSPNSQDVQPRFKIRGRASSPSSSPCKTSDVAFSGITNRPTYNGSHDYGHGSAVRPKLKLKMSRSQLGQVRPIQSEFVSPNSRLKQCNSLADLAPCPKKIKMDEQGEQVDNDTVSKKPTLSLDSDSSDSVMADEKSVRFESSPQLSDQFNIPYPPSPVKVEAYASPITPMNKATLIEIRSTCSDDKPGGPRGLRSKFSILRLRFASPQRSVSMSKESGSVPCSVANESLTPPTVVSKDANAVCGEGASSKDQSPPLEAEKAEWRVKRWARDAKRAVRLYVKKTLDRSPRASA